MGILGSAPMGDLVGAIPRRVVAVILAADDTVPWILGLLLGLVMIGAAVTIIVVNNGASNGRIGPNPGMGIRTAATRSSNSGSPS